MFGEVYYHPDSIANILSFYDISKTCKLRYNSDRNSFHVTGNHNHSILFEPIGKLYVHRCDTKFVLIETVAGNEALYTKRELDSANETKRLRHILGYPSDKDYIKLVSSGAISDLPIAVHDIVRDIKVNGVVCRALLEKASP